MGAVNLTTVADRSVITTNFTKAAIYKQKTILVECDATADDLKVKLESLTSVGSVM